MTIGQEVAVLSDGKWCRASLGTVLYKGKRRLKVQFVDVCCPGEGVQGVWFKRRTKKEYVDTSGYYVVLPVETLRREGYKVPREAPPPHHQAYESLIASGLLQDLDSDTGPWSSTSN